MKRMTVPLLMIALTLGAALYLPKGFSLADLPGLAGPRPAPDPVATDPVQLPVPGNKRIEVVFALDTTGSMSGLIQTAKDKIWSIASTMASADPAPEIAVGLVAYRDRGDEYITRVFDLTTDLDAIYAQLIQFQASGGGDGPESVNKALDDALHQISWTQRAGTYRSVFLVGDAPAHMDYVGERQFPELAELATRRGIVINTIRCGSSESTQAQWQQIAALTQGRFFSVDQNGGALAIVSPFDRKMADISAQLDRTRLGYGDAAARQAHSEKAAATAALQAKAPVAALARRGAFNASASGGKNLFGDKDLIADIESGAITLDKVREQELPSALRSLTPAERTAKVDAQRQQRAALKEALRSLADQRDSWLTEQAAEMETAEDSLDYQIFGAVKDQAASKGLVYSEAAPKL